jgi:hypothetical protein
MVIDPQKSQVRVKFNNTYCIIPDSDDVKIWLSSLGVRVNGFRFNSGRRYGTGHVLLLKRDLTDITNGATNTLEIYGNEQTVTISNLVVTDTHSFSPRNTSNELVLVSFADSRWLMMNNQTISNFDKFPPHPNYEDLANPFDDNWEDALDSYWADVETSQTLDHSNAKYPIQILRDVQTENTKGAYETFNDILALASHRLYYDGSNYKIEHLGYNNTGNGTLVNDYRERLIAKPNDQADHSAVLPNTVRVKFRKRDGDMFNQKLVVDFDYDGSLSAGDMIKDINVYNIYDETWDNDFNNGLHLVDLTQLACEIAEAYFESFDISSLYDAIYFGVVPFEHSANVDMIEYYHDYRDNKYKTAIESHDIKDIAFPQFSREIELLLETFGDQIQEVQPGAETTPDPRSNQICSGDCFWEADSNLDWVLLEDNCSETTSTTTSSTTTTVSPDSEYTRCLRNNVTTQYPTTTTSSSDPCQCLKPNYCPEEVDECVRTICSTNRVLEINCGSTTTTTTLDPACTSEDPSCTGNCTYVGSPVGPLRISGDCPAKNPNQDICGCPPPTQLAACATSVVNCTKTPPRPRACEGECSWFWYGDIWYLTFDSCTQSNADFCYCEYPSFDGSEDCEIYNSSGCVTAGDPCTTTTTSTDPSGCEQSCRWTAKSDLSGWDLDTDPCPSSCPCIPPFGTPEKDCEVKFTDCSSDNTTTTGTTTTTTTSTDDPLGACCYYITDSAGGQVVFGCDETTETDCTPLPGGTALWRGEGTNCDEPCPTEPAPTGACCEFDSVDSSFIACSITTEHGCNVQAAATGNDTEWKGPGTICNDDCFVIGACCAYDKTTGNLVTCYNYTVEECAAVTAYNTTWRNGSCSSVICPPVETSTIAP